MAPNTLGKNSFSPFWTICESPSMTKHQIACFEVARFGVGEVGEDENCRERPLWRSVGRVPNLAPPLETEQRPFPTDLRIPGKCATSKSACRPRQFPGPSPEQWRRRHQLPRLSLEQCCSQGFPPTTRPVRRSPNAASRCPSHGLGSGRAAPITKCPRPVAPNVHGQGASCTPKDLNKTADFTKPHTEQTPPDWTQYLNGGFLRSLSIWENSRWPEFQLAKKLRNCPTIDHLGRFVSRELTRSYGEIFETARKFGKRGISKKGSPGQKRLLNRCQDGIYEEGSCVACPGL